MNDFLKKYIEKILIIFLFLQPVIDLFTSISLNLLHINLSIGIIVRILFLLFLIYFYLFVKKSISKKRKWYLLSVLIFLGSFSLMIIMIKDMSALSYELQNILKLFYFPLLLTVIDSKDIKINYMDLVKIAIIYLVFISVPTILGLEFNSYTQGKTGSVGWFNSGNEISAILSILTPFLIYYLFTKHNIFNKLFLIILMGYTYFIIGSKIIIISLIVSLIFNIVLYFKNNKVDKHKLTIYICVFLLLIFMGFILIPRTNFYHNLIIHLNYLGINSFQDIFSYNFINRFIFSDRLTYLSSTNLNFIWSKPIEKILGLGFIESFGTDFVYIKAIEMDFFDMFYRTGIVGFIILMCPLIISLKNKFKQNILTPENKIVNFSIILGLIIALFVGHTLSAPGVAIYIIYLFKLKNK